MLGICNGFQILSEAGLLPGALRRMKVSSSCARRSTSASRRTARRSPRRIAPGDAPPPDQPFRGQLHLCDRDVWPSCGPTTASCSAIVHNPNGSIDAIAGVCSAGRNVVGLMPHPERACHELLGSTDGAGVLASALARCGGSARPADPRPLQHRGRHADLPPRGVGDAFALAVALGDLDESVSRPTRSTLAPTLPSSLSRSIRSCDQSASRFSGVGHSSSVDRGFRRFLIESGVRLRPRLGVVGSSASRYRRTAAALGRPAASAALCSSVMVAVASRSLLVFAILHILRAALCRGYATWQP